MCAVFDILVKELKTGGTETADSRKGDTYEETSGQNIY